MTEANYKVSPLVGLSFDTIRKYIAVLWKEGRFEKALKFDYIDQVAESEKAMRDALDKIMSNE